MDASSENAKLLKVLAELDAELAERDAELAARDAELAARDADLAARDAELAECRVRISGLEKRLGELVEKLSQNSGNSNLPPSSDGPGKGSGGRPKKKRKGGRKRGGQPGHGGSHRGLVSANQVDEFVDLFPAECKSCWAALPETPDVLARRYQLTELQPIQPRVTEFRRHAVRCPACGFKTIAAYDRSVIPNSPFGPRLMSVVAMLTGVYHLSRRQTVRLMREVLGVRLSLGAVSRIEERLSDAVAPAVGEARRQVLEAKVKHTDGTSWMQSGVMLSLWTVATAAATVFEIMANGQKATLKLLLSEQHGILVSDRATALTFWEMERRQICWAHLLRKFVSFSQRDGPAGSIGQELLELTGVLFDYHRACRAGTLPRTRFREWMVPVREQFEAALERAVAADIPRLSGSCKDMLKHRAALWTFVDRDDVEPTNNHAERELRGFVLWRKRSFGTQSERGNRFAKRLMTIAHTARKQGRNVLAFLTTSCEAFLNGSVGPSLFAAV